MQIDLHAVLFYVYVYPACALIRLKEKDECELCLIFFCAVKNILQINEIINYSHQDIGQRDLVALIC